MNQMGWLRQIRSKPRLAVVQCNSTGVSTTNMSFVIYPAKVQKNIHKNRLLTTGQLPLIEQVAERGSIMRVGKQQENNYPIEIEATSAGGWVLRTALSN